MKYHICIQFPTNVFIFWESNLFVVVVLNTITFQNQKVHKKVFEKLTISQMLLHNEEIVIIGIKCLYFDEQKFFECIQHKRKRSFLLRSECSIWICSKQITWPKSSIANATIANIQAPIIILMLVII